MTIMEVANLIALNKSNYPNAYKNMTSREAELLAKSWHSVLKNHEAETVFNAFGVALTRSEFPVTLAGIFTVLKEKKNSLLPTVDELFNIAFKAARTIRDSHHQDIGWTDREAAYAAYDSLPAILREWKHSPMELVRWLTSCNEESYARHQFKEIMQDRLSRREALGIGFNEELRPVFDFTTNCLKSLDDAIGQKQIGEKYE